MDHNQINLDDFIEVEPESTFIVMNIGQKHKKLKNYNKAIQKFEKSLDKELFYVKSQADNFILEGKYKGHVIIDQAGNVTEIEDIPIIGTQMILQEREIVYKDQFKHLINIDPKKSSRGIKIQKFVSNDSI
ncbi:hypothetical protein pb186bvf_003846 [Paramecium bursaria]